MTAVTRFDSTALTAAATTEPSSLKCWSMPILRPRMSGFAIFGASAFVSVVSVSSVVASAFSSLIPTSLELDLDVDARRKVQLHEGVDRLLRWIVDVDEALVRPGIELFARVVVAEGALGHCV